MKKLLLIFLFISLYSCSEENFFSEFDEVDYYTLKNDSLISFENKNDSIALKIYNEDYPFDLKNVEFYKIINQDRFIKRNIIKSDINLLGKIFTTKNKYFETSNACIPNYRDILILKKEDSIIGIIKICMECEKYQFIGNIPKVDEYNFSQTRNFEDLDKIFRKYNK